MSYFRPRDNTHEPETVNVHEYRPLYHDLQSPFSRLPKQQRLPILVAGVRAEAIPDTGAMVNAISERFLGQLKAEVRPELGWEDNVVQIGNDTTASAMYRVGISCRLIDGKTFASEEQQLSFHVFRNLAQEVKVIIGQKFLFDNRIMTTRSHLLMEVNLEIPSLPRCMSIGPVIRSGLRMKVYIDGSPVMALPDTGSEVDLISTAFAGRLRLDIRPLKIRDTKMIQFADGTIGELSGKTTVRFDTHMPKGSSHRRSTFDDIPVRAAWPYTGGYDHEDGYDHEGGYDHEVTFYVLDKLRHEVILSQQLLYALDAFNQHASAMQLIDDKNALQTIIEHKHKKKITELTVSDLKAIRKRDLQKYTVEEKQLREQLASARNPSEQEEVERKLNDLERLRQEEGERFVREMERKRRRT